MSVLPPEGCCSIRISFPPGGPGHAKGVRGHVHPSRRAFLDRPRLPGRPGAGLPPPLTAAGDRLSSQLETGSR
ncbi:hypothetical protein GCM10010485_53920 [Streptosporangium carneum]